MLACEAAVLPRVPLLFQDAEHMMSPELEFALLLGVVSVEDRRAVVWGRRVLLASVTELLEQRGSAGDDGIAGVRTQARTRVPGPA